MIQTLLKLEKILCHAIIMTNKKLNFVFGSAALIHVQGAVAFEEFHLEQL